MVQGVAQLADKDRVAVLQQSTEVAQEDEAEALAERMMRLDARLERTNVAQLRAGEFA